MQRLYRVSLALSCKKEVIKEVAFSALEGTLTNMLDLLREQKQLSSAFTLTVESFDPKEEPQDAPLYEVDVLAEQIMLFDREPEIRSFVDTEKMLSSNPVEQLTELSVALIKLSQRLSLTRQESGMMELPSISHRFSKEELDSMEELCYHNLSVVRERRKKTDTCVICWERYAERILLPCMHLAVCGGCSQHQL